MGVVGHVAHMGEMRNVYKILVGKSEGKGPLRKHRQKWEYIIRMNLREIGWEDVDWIHLKDMDQWQALVKMVMDLQVPKKVRNFLTS
jgi:hypothetical protein